MPDDHYRLLADLFGGVDKLIGKLNIAHLPDARQEAILERFTSLVWKRLLLRADPRRTGDIAHALGEDIDVFTETLSASIPDIDRAIAEELEKAIAEFRLQ